MRFLAVFVALPLVLLPGVGAHAEEPVPSPSAIESTIPATEPTPPPVLAPPFRAGDSGPGIARLQARLAWLGYRIGRFEAGQQLYGTNTEAAVKAFQRKFWLPPSGTADARTVRVIDKMSGRPNSLPASCSGDFDAICIDKTAKLLRLVRNGKVTLTLDARFGTDKEPTSEGIFKVMSKSRNHTSSLYETWMPFSLFYFGNEAIHYSSYFARDGYSGASHGCINLRDFEKSKWLFDQVSPGTRVVVYRS